MTNRVFKNKPNELITTTDGRKLYNSRSVAVTGCIGARYNNKIHFIIEKRGNAEGLDNPGKWCLPCGYLDWNESGPDAIKREVWEEVGLDIDVLDTKYQVVVKYDYMSQPWWVKTEPDENRQNISLRYARVYNIEIGELPKLTPNNDCMPNEVADAKWITLDEIDNYEFVFNHKNVLIQFFTK
jgi:8-oxo-dGTP pyrophosphatase MutT (NUDIX family)